MHVAKSYGDKVKTVLNLDARALYALCAPKTPLEVREEIEKMIEANGSKSEIVSDLPRQKRNSYGFEFSHDGKFVSVTSLGGQRLNSCLAIGHGNYLPWITARM